MNYRDTLNLPKDLLPMRANLPQREPEIQAFWEAERIYERSVEREPRRGTFVLHDGPPYSNGDIHMGHALNKILKDFVTRHRTMQGYRAPYVPGWDNHGLPIEHTILQEARRAGEHPDRGELRRRCRSYAQKWFEIQRAQFRRLGIRGLWDRPYLTMAPHFEARIAELFAELALRGYVYRDLKPILWCPHDETALAEAEVEYDEKTSPSVYVRFPLLEDPHGRLPAGEPCYTIVWTTTPWTIPANLAVAFHPEHSYVVVRAGGSLYLLAEALLEPTLAACGLGEGEIVSRRTGAELEGTVFRHPLHHQDPVYDRPSPAVLADYVTMDAGTGVVHTAPGHGEEDFRTGRLYGLEILNPVDEQGRFTAQAGLLEGKSIRTGEADAAVLELLEESGHLLQRAPYRHNYPHCWRCRGPVIFRTTVQWFMRIDQRLEGGETHRSRCMEEIRRVRWIPAASVRRIEAMVAGRPDWCLSRQRAWGVGIPVFYCDACREPIQTPESLLAAVALVRDHGADAWFTTEAEAILPPGFACPHCGAAGPFSRETDVLDVWFDSGSTWSAVLDERRWEHLRWPADLYLEGSDQHRGWFNSSLMLSVALRGRAPYESVLSHGFVLDGKGEKMSKSLGNAIDPLEEIERGGADLLRLWVASTDYADDVRLSDEILEHIRNVYLRIRNTLRFLVGNLAGFDPSAHRLAVEEREEVDRWAMHRLGEAVRDCTDAYQACRYHEVFHHVQNLCAVDLGAFYLDVIKDRLYCSPPAGRLRRSGQSTLWDLADTLTRLLAPILAHTAEEVWQAIPGCRERHVSVHLAEFPEPADYPLDPALAARWARIREARDCVNGAIEPLKPKFKNDPNFVLKSGLEAKAVLEAGPDWIDLLRSTEPLLADAFMTARVEVVPRDEPGLAVRVERAEGTRCDRCWLVLPTVGECGEHPGLCRRCVSAVTEAA